MSEWKGALRKSAKVVLRPALPVLRWFRSEHTHIVVKARGTTSAFGIMGSPRWAPRFTRLYFAQREHASRHHRPHGRSWVQHARALSERHGLVVIADTPVPSGIADDLVRMPTYVALRIDLQDSEAAYRATLSRSARMDLQKIRAKQFTFEVLRDPEWAEAYYRDFHRPSVWGRHGEEGFIMPAADIADMVRNREGEFLVVLQDGRRVGAMLNEREGDEYVMRRIGWLDGDPAWPREGVISALYWRSFQRARELGFRHVQLGGTPPLLDDGLFQYKCKWNVALDRAATVWGHYSLLLSPSHPDVQRMLAAHPLIVHDARDALVVLSGKFPHEVRMSPATAGSITRWYRLCEAPDAGRAHENADLPAPIRAWFRAEPIPA